MPDIILQGLVVLILASLFIHHCCCCWLDEELLPIADAGKDVVITLPQRTAILNGSLSKDGFGIVSYQWIRTSDSPAAGTGTHR